MIERRFTPGACEYRASADNVPPMIGGHAAVFNKLSRNLGGFVEQLDPAVFNYSAAQGFPDVVARFNHDDMSVLGTTQAKTLVLAIDSVGLRYDVIPPATRADVLELVQRGDVTKSSFAFRTVQDDWGMTDQGYPLRTLQSVELVDVAPVVTSAYPDADAGLRSLARRVDAPFAEVRKLAEDNELSRFFKRTDTRWSASPLSPGVGPGTVPGDENQLPLPPEVLPDIALNTTYDPEPYHADPDETIMCTNCDCMNSPDARFCDQCGRSLMSPGAAVVCEPDDDAPTEPAEGQRDDDGDGDETANALPADGDQEGDEEQNSYTSDAETRADEPASLFGPQAMMHILNRRECP